MCADKNVGLAVGKIAQDAFIGCTGTCRVKVEAGGAGVWKEVMNFFFNLFRAKTELPQVGTFAVGAGLWNCKRLAAIVAHQSVLFLMISEGHVAGLAGGSPPADGAFDLSGLNIPEEDLKALFGVDKEGWKAVIPQIEAHFAKFGAKLPKALVDQLDILKKNLA